MEAKLCIYICNSLVPEVSHFLQTTGHADVKVKSFPSVCVGCPLTNQRILEMVSNDIDHYSKIIVIVSSCRGKKHELPVQNKKIEVIQIEQCFEIFINRTLIYHFFKQGYYVVSNGWLRNYNRHVAEWGFDEKSAKKFFNESIRKLMLIDTGLPGDYFKNLEALSAYTGLDYEVIPVGNEHLAKFFESLIFSWKSEEERSTLNDNIAKISQESAEYSLLFYQLKTLIDFTNETSIVKEISSLIDMLFAPGEIFFQQYLKDQEGERYFLKKPPEILTFNESDSFVIEIKRHGDLLGIFGVVKVLFPNFLARYKLLGELISQIGALAIANARKYGELEDARFQLSLSEDRFKSIYTQAPLGIALVNSITGEMQDLNSKFAEIAGRSRDELLGMEWMGITHPEDMEEDLDNMAKLNAGEIPGFHMNKRYLKPDGSIVWISMTIAPIQVVNKAFPVHLCMIEDITERKNLEEKILKSERLFKAVMLQSPSVIELYDLYGVQISVNQAYEELWGFEASRTINKFNILKSEEVKRTGLIDYVIRAYNGESVQVPEYYFDSTGKTEGRGKGRGRWLSTRIYPLKDENEKVSNIIITHEDVTISRQAESILKDNLMKFKKLSDSATDMIALQEEADVYNYLTSKLSEQYPKAIVLFSTIDETEKISSLKIIKGISENAIKRSIKLTGFDFFKKPFKLLSSHQQIFKTGSFYHFEGGLSSFSGPEFPDIAAKAIEKLLGIRNIYTIGINKDDKLFAIFHFFNRDKNPITDNDFIETFVKQAAIVIERKVLENKLRESEERYRFIAENMSDVIWSINVESLRFNYISPSVVNLTGFTVEEAMQQRIEEALEEKSARYVLEELPKRIVDYYEGRREQMVAHHELQQRCKDGSVIWVEYTTMFRVDKHGKVTSLIGITRNIDERKKAELDIQKKNQELSIINAEKDKFFSIIAHDLRSPFASLVSLSELMSDESFDLSNEEARNFARSLHKISSSTYALLENLLEWSMLQRGVTVFRPEKINLNKFFDHCDDAIVEMAMKKSIDLNVRVEDNVFIQADPNMLKTVMRNLVSNAIKFTQSGGEIFIFVEPLNSKGALFKIKDSGIGMEPEILQNLFKIDKNVSRPGTNGEPSTGLGLILCKEFVERHGGKIWATDNKVEDPTSIGSTFCFTIP